MGWILRVVAWDGLLPLFVVSVPVVLLHVFPGRRELVNNAMVFGPTIATILRVFEGYRIIVTNRCTPAFRACQFVALAAGILILLLIELLLLHSHENPQRMDFKTEDLIFISGMFGSYLLVMGLATYPGAAAADPEEDPDTLAEEIEP